MHQHLTEAFVSKYGKPAEPDVSDQRERTTQDAPQAQSPGRPVLRLFVGIPLAVATAQDLITAVNHLRSTANQRAAANNLRWSAPESWHITLQFLGSATPQQYECVIERLRALCQPPVSIKLGAIGIFDRAGVFFVDVHVTSQLLALQQAVTAATAPCGFIPENRPYHPHITLARRKGKGGGGELRDLKLQIDRQPKASSFTAGFFVLYESIPTPEGSRYEIRERFSLDSRSSG
jgi:RNA 2',3'-cyclic 3'-phosphodiesterase